METERRWIEGELDEITGRWREAEQIAAIADQLLTPAWISDRLRPGTRGEPEP